MQYGKRGRRALTGVARSRSAAALVLGMGLLPPCVGAKDLNASFELGDLQKILSKQSLQADSDWIEPWEASVDREVFKYPASVATTGPGAMVAAGWANSTVSVHDAITGTQVNRWKLRDDDRGRVEQLWFSRNGRVLFAGVEVAGVEDWWYTLDVTTGERIGRFGQAYRAVATSQNGRYVVAYGKGPSPDRRLHVIDAQTGGSIVSERLPKGETVLSIRHVGNDRYFVQTTEGMQYWRLVPSGPDLERLGGVVRPEAPAEAEGGFHWGFRMRTPEYLYGARGSQLHVWELPNLEPHRSYRLPQFERVGFITGLKDGRALIGGREPDRGDGVSKYALRVQVDVGAEEYSLERLPIVGQPAPRTPYRKENFIFRAMAESVALVRAPDPSRATRRLDRLR